MSVFYLLINNIYLKVVLFTSLIHLASLGSLVSSLLKIYVYIYLGKNDSKLNFCLRLRFLDLCMNPQSLKGALKYITADSCKAAGGKWTRFITNYVEKSEGVLDSCIDKSVHLVRGLAYESHLLSQGADKKRQYVVVQDPPEVIYAPSTVVNHNGMNMEGKFSSYKWKVPCFPSNTTQRCVLRIR